MNNTNFISVKSKKGRLYLAGCVLLVVLVIVLIVFTILGMGKDSDTSVPTVSSTEVSAADIITPPTPDEPSYTDSNPSATQTTTTTQTEATTSTTIQTIVPAGPDDQPNANPPAASSDTQPGKYVKYGVVPIDPKAQIQLLNVYDDSSDVLTGQGTIGPDGSVTVTLGGKVVTGEDIPERIELDNGYVMWSKRVYISSALTSAQVYAYPFPQATDCSLTVTYPNGRIKSAADNIFTFPAENIYSWREDYPDGGVYTFTLIGQNLETFEIGVPLP